MINKQSVWFVTLFSLILVLAIYYVTMQDSSLQKIIENSQNPNPEHFENDDFNEISPYKETIANKIANKEVMKAIKGVD